MEVLGSRRPKNVGEYFTWLYCKRKKLRWGVSGTKIHKKAFKTWKTLTAEEQDVFINKYNKWQAENDKRVANILQYAEPFMKKKHTISQKSDGETRDSSDDNQAEQTMDSLHMSASNDANFSEVTDQVNIDDVSHITEAKDTDIDDNQKKQMAEYPHTLLNDDSLSIATSETTNQVYAASVIDTDIDETPGQQEVNTPIQSEILTEPMQPTVKNARELFEIFQSSGTRPELAAIQWKDLSKKEKYKYQGAIQTMKRQYLIQYEQYLESLSSPDLFKHYIKTLRSFLVLTVTEIIRGRKDMAKLQGFLVDDGTLKTSRAATSTYVQKHLLGFCIEVPISKK